MLQNSRISQTGKNFLLALTIAIIPALLLTVIFSVADVLFKLTGRKEVEATTAIKDVLGNFFNAFFDLSTCVVLVVTIFAFALLQRFRIKEPETTDETE